MVLLRLLVYHSNMGLATKRPMTSCSTETPCVRLVVACVLLTATICLSCNDSDLPPLPRPALVLSPFEPCEDYEGARAEFRQFYERVRAALIDVSLQSTETYALFEVFPSFSPEWVVGIYVDESEAVVEYRVARVQIWRANLKRVFDEDGNYTTELRDEPAEVFVDWETEALDLQTWHRLRDVLVPSLVWAERSGPPEYYGDDGVTYRFSFRSPEAGELCGQAWSPDSETVPGQLVLIAEQLRDFTTVERKSRKTEILSAIDHHLRKLEPW